MPRSFVHIVNIILLLVLFGGSMMLYSGLPERMPVHMGLDGKVDAWGERSLLAWLELPLVAVGISALTYVIGLYMGRFPHLINLPGKEKFVDLSAERQSLVLSMIRGSLYWTTAALLVVFVLIQTGMYQAAQGRASMGYTITALVLSLGVIPFISLTLIMRVDAAVKATRHQTPPISG